jgi:tetratricopeptide (TPR) repeat protein
MGTLSRRKAGMSRKKGDKIASTRKAPEGRGNVKEGTAPHVSKPLRQKGLILALFLGLILLLYGNSLRNEFTNWDDQMIYANPSIRSLDWKSIMDLFTLKKASSYQPVRALSYAVDYRLWGLNPLGYHLSNLFFYLLTCITVFYTAQLLLEKIVAGSPSSTWRTALFSSLLFAAHPVHVEAVTWLAARKEVLQGFFFFLSFYLYMKAGEVQERRKRWIYTGSVLLTFLLAVLSKPSAVALPGLFLLYEASRKGEGMRRFFQRHWLFILSSAGISLLFFLILLKVMSEAEGIKSFYGASMASNLVISVYLVLYNIKLLAFTTAYAAAYTITASFSILSKYTLLAFAATLLLFGVVLWSRKKTSLYFFCFFWFLITLLPFLNIVPISILLADRYVFLASFGYCLVAGSLLNRIFEAGSGMALSNLFKALGLVFFLTLMAGYSWMTVQQNRVWRDSFSLWSDSVRKYPWSNLGNAMMGTVLLKRGEDREAVKHLERAIRVRPTDALSRAFLGYAYDRLDQPAKALEQLWEAVRLMPNETAIRLQLAEVYSHQKEYEKAEQILKDALARNPKSEEVRLRLGDLYRRAGRLQDAIHQLEETLGLFPQRIGAYEALGNLYLSILGNPEKAIHYYSEAIRMAPKPSPKTDELRWVIQDLEH